jgi:hypothetical protein
LEVIERQGLLVMIMSGPRAPATQFTWRTGPTPDRFMKQFGRGGAGGGYAPSQPVRFNQPASSNRGCNHRQLSLAPVVICKVVRRERQFPANPCLGVDYGLRPFPKGWVRAQGVVVVTSSAGTCWMVGEGGDSEIVWPHPVSGALLMLVT